MSRRAAVFAQADVERAVKGVRAAGVAIAAIRIEQDGSIHITAGTPGLVIANDAHDAGADFRERLKALRGKGRQR